ncbi:hypothetical protein Tco_0252721 [Tanacetum coccineum]
MKLRSSIRAPSSVLQIKVSILNTRTVKSERINKNKRRYVPEGVNPQCFTWRGSDYLSVGKRAVIDNQLKCISPTEDSEDRKSTAADPESLNRSFALPVFLWMCTRFFLSRDHLLLGTFLQSYPKDPVSLIGVKIADCAQINSFFSQGANDKVPVDTVQHRGPNHFETPHLSFGQFLLEKFVLVLYSKQPLPVVIVVVVTVVVHCWCSLFLVVSVVVVVVSRAAGVSRGWGRCRMLRRGIYRSGKDGREKERRSSGDERMSTQREARRHTRRKAGDEREGSERGRHRWGDGVEKGRHKGPMERKEDDELGESERTKGRERRSEKRKQIGERRKRGSRQGAVQEREEGKFMNGRTENMNKEDRWRRRREREQEEGK